MKWDNISLPGGAAVPFVGQDGAGVRSPGYILRSPASHAYLRAMVGMHPPEDTYANVHSGSVHNRKELDTFQIPISVRTDNQAVLCPCNRMLPSSKPEYKALLLRTHGLKLVPH